MDVIAKLTDDDPVTDIKEDHGWHKVHGWKGRREELGMEGG
jgi:hypothetical protein